MAMILFARLMYGALLWKERRYAKRSGGLPPRKASDGERVNLETGRRGETLVYWYLRRAGYIMVARNRRAGARSGELDLVGWDGSVLAFIEVKTRSSMDAGPPQAAVTRDQQQRIARAARQYLRRLKGQTPNYRFDIASVSWDPQRGFQVGIIKDAFKG